MLSDEEIVRAAQGGDALSLGILLERHRAPLYALDLRILGHRPQQISAGEAYYARPGHVTEVLEDAQTVEFSPKEPFEQLLEVVGKNLEAMGES